MNPINLLKKTVPDENIIPRGVNDIEREEKEDIKKIPIIEE